MNADQLEQQAIELISVDILKLSPGVQSGTARNLVRYLIDAAVARIADQKQQTLRLPSKGRHE